MGKLFDVVAIGLDSGKVEAIFGERKTIANAEAIVLMALRRRALGKEFYKPVEVKTVTKTCTLCKKDIELTAPESEWRHWESGALIQRALLSLNDGERELLISGICGPCFDALFEAEEEV